MQNELNFTNEELVEKQDYLDYIDADIEGFLAVKAESLGFDVTGL